MNKFYSVGLRLGLVIGTGLYSDMLKFKIYRRNTTLTYPYDLANRYKKLS